MDASCTKRGCGRETLHEEEGSEQMKRVKKRVKKARVQNSPRIVAWIDPMGFVEDRGYRVSLVVEGEDGHYPTGDWPYHGKPGETLPWFWGPSLEEAETACDEYNQKHGIDPKTAAIIVAQTMGLGRTARAALP
jgi:hypothetical protein